LYTKSAGRVREVISSMQVFELIGENLEMK